MEEDDEEEMGDIWEGEGMSGKEMNECSMDEIWQHGKCNNWKTEMLQAVCLFKIAQFLEKINEFREYEEERREEQEG